MHLYETHLPVANTEIAKAFYTEIVGLPFAYRDPTRDIVFFWAASKEQGMIGLWGPNTAYGRQNGIAGRCHVAFAVPLDQLVARIKKLHKHGIETLGFSGHKTHEPTVIGCPQRRFISEIPMGTCSNSSASCQIPRTQVSTDRTRNGKN